MKDIAIIEMEDLEETKNPCIPVGFALHTFEINVKLERTHGSLKAW